LKDVVFVVANMLVVDVTDTINNLVDGQDSGPESWNVSH